MSVFPIARQLFRREPSRSLLPAKARRWLQAAAVVAATVVPSASMAQTQALTPFKLQHYTGILIMAPVYVAMEEQFFKKHGLDVGLFGINEGNVAMAALSNGSLDAMFITPGYVLTFDAKGPPEKAVQISNDFAAPIYNLVGLNETIAACPDAAKPYPAPLKCMKGKRLGVTAVGSDNYNVLISMLKTVGLNESDVQILALGGGVQLPDALRAKQADYILSAEPAATEIVDVLKIGKDLVDLTADPLMADWSGEGAYALKSAVDKDPKKYQEFADAMADAIAFINDPANVEKVVKDFSKYSPQDPVLIKAELVRHHAQFKAKTDCQAITNVSKWLVETGQLANGQASSCDDFIWSGDKKN